DGLARKTQAYKGHMQKAPKAPRKSASKAATRKVSTPTTKSTRAAAKTPKTADGNRGSRRTIFIDVENTSSETALLGALDQLGVDHASTPTELVAVGNWRVIGQHVARMLAQRGARLMHTAPATGVKDWSDLSI